MSAAMAISTIQYLTQIEFGPGALEKLPAGLAAQRIARPLIVNDIVVVRTVDGHIDALAVTDGARRWSVDQQEPSPRLGVSLPLGPGNLFLGGQRAASLRILPVDPVRIGD